MQAPRVSSPSERPNIVIRPGVTLPDWSVVTSGVVGNALKSLFETCDWEERWSGLGIAQDRARRAIIEFYASRGCAPTARELAVMLEMNPGETRDLIKELKLRDIVVLDEDEISIVGAYPFIDRQTEHLVRIGDITLHAMCAVDALGAGAMLGLNTTIDSSCRHCSGAIHVETGRQGAVLAAVAPVDALVWLGIHYENGCAADSLCTSMAFFCSQAHLKAWHAAQTPRAPGERLSMAQALQAGKAIFQPLLRVPEKT